MNPPPALHPTRFGRWSEERRWNLLLTALGAYIVGVPIVGMLAWLIGASSGLDQWRSEGKSVLQLEEAHRYVILGWGYVVCLVVLAAAIPSLSERRARRCAFGFIALGLILLALFVYPMTQVAKAK